MFKKDPQAKVSANIKSSERRKLLQNICSVYNIPKEQTTKEGELRILPNITKQASFKSVQGISGTIYFDENEVPIWFKARDSEIYPSVFTLWKCGFLLPIVKTHPHVIKILSNGADLMLPGTIPPFDTRCTKGSIVGVADSANPTVIKAIGRCRLNLTQFNNVVGRTGTAVEIFHCINDELYNSNKYVDIPVPEEVDLKMPLNLEEGEEEVIREDENKGKKDEKEVHKDLKEETEQEQAEADLNINDFADQVSQLSIEEIDNFFVRSLLQTIKLETIEMPISSSTFMSNYIYKNLPVIDFSYCNIKKTSWKKTAKFLKAMDKLKYLTVKGKGDDLTITRLMNKDNATIENFITHKAVGSKSTSTSQQPTSSKKSNELSIIYLFKPTNSSRMLFNKVNENFNSYYTSSELRNLLDKYIKLQGLVDPKSPRNIVIDDVLKSITNLVVGPAPRDKVFKPFLAKFSPYFKILKPGELPENAQLHKGDPPKISIITEMKIGRKIITRISKFEEFYIKPHLLSDELKVKCSGSSTIGQCVQNPKLTEVTVQGPHGKLIIDLLREKGIPVAFIEFEDKVKKGKKR